MYAYRSTDGKAMGHVALEAYLRTKHQPTQIDTKPISGIDPKDFDADRSIYNDHQAIA